MNDAVILTALFGAITVLAGTVAALFKLYLGAAAKISDLQTSEGRCRNEVTYLTGEVIRLSAEVERLSSSAEDDPSEAKIVADVGTGMIIRWSPGATAMFHFTQREMLGKSPGKLLPARYQDQYGQAWAKFAQENRPPSGEPIRLWALLKDGSEIPVQVCLAAWAEKDRVMVGARIRRRLTEPMVVADGPPK